MQTNRSLPLSLSSPAEQAEFDKFKVRQNHIVTSRTYLYDLYQEVGDIHTFDIPTDIHLVRSGGVAGPYMGH